MSKTEESLEAVSVDLLNFSSECTFGEQGPPEKFLICTGHKQAKVEEITWAEFRRRQIRLKIADRDNVVRTEGWFIVVCCCLINILILGFFKSLGMLMIEFRRVFNVGPAQISVVVSVTYCLNSIAGPLACFLVIKYSPRSVALTGTIMVSAGLILSWFATSVLHLCFTIGVLGGFGSGLTYSPGLILVGSYFTKNRGMANALVVSGSPIGGMIMPYALNMFINHLGCRGALLIMGGFMLHSCLCALSFVRPRQFSSELPTNSDFDTTEVETEDEEKDKTKTKSESVFDQESFIETEAIRRLQNESHETQLNSDSMQDAIYTKTTSSQSCTAHKIHEIYGMRARKNVYEWGTSAVSVPKLYLGREPLYGERPWFMHKSYLPKSSNESGFTIDRQKNISNLFPVNKNPSRKPRKTQKIDTNSHYVLSLDHSCVVLLSNDNFKRRDKQISKLHRDRCGKNWSKKLPPSPQQPDTDSNDNIKTTESDKDKNKSAAGDSDDRPPKQKKRFSCCPRNVCKRRRDVTYFKLSALKAILKNPLYIVLLISNAAPAISTTNVLLLIPSYAEYLGMSRNDYSNIYFMISLFDLIGRLVGAVLSDKGILLPRTVYAIGLFFAGICNMFMAGSTDYVSLTAVSSVFGLATGFHIGIMGVLLQEIVGTEMLPVGYALSMVLNGLLVLVGPCICGYILSAHTGMYWPLYAFFGIVLVLGASLWLIPICYEKLPKEKDDDNASSSLIT